MSVWRRKAIECLPALQELRERDVSIYTVFSALRAATVAAHQKGDHESLTKYYAFAEWCLTQKAKDLWNAAGVAFYEHLGDREETMNAMPQWVKKSIYVQIRELLPKEKMQQIDKLYQL